MTSFTDKFLDKIRSAKSYNSLYKIPLKLFKNKNPTSIVSRPIKILLLTSTCNGFGDVIFAHKLKKYLQDWYGSLVDVKIATNSVQQFISIKEDTNSLIHLSVTATDNQCNPFNMMESYNATKFINSNLLVPEDIESFDLYFVAPITYDFTPNYNEIRRLVKSSNRFNTFFLCEYNYPIHKDVLFNVGIGNDRLGIFLISDQITYPKLPVFKHPYSIIYIAQNDDHISNCYLGFLELLTAKYRLPRLEIVCPDWMKNRIEKDSSSIINSVHENYSRIMYVYKNGEEVVIKYINGQHQDGNELIFRLDILPVPFTMMLSIYQHSLPHVLLTGDQSITDFLSLRHKTSMPFYQGLPWKQNFYTKLAKALPNKFFRSYKTSCGNLDAIKYDPSFTRFIKNNDFRIKAKPLMDAVICSAGYESDEYKEIKDKIVHSRKLATLKRKILKS
jgi:hypothetical protein